MKPIFLGLPMLLLLASPGSADSREELKKGLAAADFNNWQQAATHFQAAIDEDPAESSQQVFVSGVFSTPYLPHFQLGQAWFRLDPDTRCAAAVAAWDESLRQGVIRQFKRKLKELERDRATCLERLVPELKSTLRTLRGEVRSAGETWKDATVPAGQEAERARLDAARSRFETRADQALASTRTDLLQQSVQAGQDLLAELRRFAGSVDQGRAEVLDTARSTARRAVIDAEAARDSLTDADGFPTALSAEERDDYDRRAQTLQGLRSRLDAASNVAAAEAVEREARSVGTAFDTLRSSLAQARRQSLAQAPPSNPSTAQTQPTRNEPTRTVPPTERRVVPPPPEPRADGNGDGARGNDGERIRRLLEAVGEPPSQAPWASLYDELQTLAEGAGESLTASQAAQRERLIERRVRSLVLLSGMDAFFERRHRQALNRLLSASDALVGNDAPENARRLEAQILLFRAAARFHLFRLGGGVESELLTTLEEDLRQGRRFDPDLLPSAHYFSPAFRRVFDQAVGSPKGP